MKYRKLGASDLNVSEISLGSWLTFGVGIEKDKTIACVNKSFELGINFIDTANVYGRGASETVLGEALAGRKRDSYILATKVFGDMGDGNQGLSRVQIEKQSTNCSNGFARISSISINAIATTRTHRSKKRWKR